MPGTKGQRLKPASAAISFFDCDLCRDTGKERADTEARLPALWRWTPEKNPARLSRGIQHMGL